MLEETNVRACPNGHGHCLCGNNPCSAIKAQQAASEKWARETGYGRTWVQPDNKGQSCADREEHSNS